jgi:AraC-like DNA-binding protein
VRQTDAKRSGSLPSTTGSITRLAFARARDAGIDVKPLVKKAGLTIQQIEDRSARIPVHNQIQFLELSAGALGDELLGFHLAREYDRRQIGLLHYVMASSETLDDAIQRAARYSTIVNEGVAVRYVQRDDIVIGVDYVGVARHSDRHQIEFWMTGLVRSCRELSGRHLLPLGVRFAHHRHGDWSELTAYFGCEVEFDAGVDQATFPGSIKDLAVVGSDPYLNNLLIASCEDALAQRTIRSGSLRSDIENAIAPLLPHGKVTVAEIARRLGLSQRTLARRLAAEGLTFGKILDEMRADLAQRHVRSSAYSISQIAWLLGYQEASAFTHAFKRWTGRTPRAMRARDTAARA